VETGLIELPNLVPLEGVRCTQSSEMEGGLMRINTSEGTTYHPLWKLTTLSKKFQEMKGRREREDSLGNGDPMVQSIQT